MTTPFEAIPTVYRGVSMRSRAEADTARLLDLLQIKWQYESTSVALPNGQHYRPDFIVPAGHPLGVASWIEVRGYYTADSVRQINTVARNVALGQLPCRTFVCITDDQSIGPVAGSFVGSRDFAFAAACDTQWRMRLCLTCKRARPVVGSLLVDEMCSFCYDQQYLDAAVKFVNGYVSIAQLDSWEPKSATRLRDIPDGTDMVALFKNLPVDVLP